MREEPDADVLAELTAPRRLTKAAPVDPVLGLTQPAVVGASGRVVPPAPQRPGSVTGGPWTPEQVVAGEHRPPAPKPVAPPTVQRRKQGGYYAHDADIDRARAAWAHTALRPDGYASWSEFQLAGVMALTERMEAVHNGGEPFDPLPPGKVRHSRRAPD